MNEANTEAKKMNRIPWLNSYDVEGMIIHFYNKKLQATEMSNKKYAPISLVSLLKYGGIYMIKPYWFVTTTIVVKNLLLIYC